MNKGLLSFLTALLSLPVFATDVDRWEPGRVEGSLDKLLEIPVAPPAQTVTISADELAALGKAKVDEAVPMPSLRTGLSKSSTLELRRIDIHAPGAKNIVPGKGILPHSNRRYFLAADRYAGLGLVLEPASGSVRGFMVQGDERYRIASAAGPKGQGLTLALRSFSQENLQPDFQCALDQQEQPLTSTSESIAHSGLDAAAKGSGTLLYGATIAVDTDNEFLTNKFGDDARAAVQWIEELFIYLNVIYQRDFAMRILKGTTILRDSSKPDPYSNNNGLREFSSHWLNDSELQGIDRAFAMLLSGQNIGELSFAGVAWLDQYCENTPRHRNQYWGSFSMNRIGSHDYLDPAFASGGIGHELGHNLGSDHTHGEQLAAGGTDWVDHCYNQYDGSGSQIPGYYYGPTMCPVDGVGSMMSYCHAPADGFDGSGPDQGPAGKCDNSSEFDPLIISKLSGLIQQNNPSCIADYSEGSGGGVAVELIFADGFGEF